MSGHRQITYGLAAGVGIGLLFYAASHVHHLRPGWDWALDAAGLVVLAAFARWWRRSIALERRYIARCAERMARVPLDVAWRHREQEAEVARALSGPYDHARSRLTLVAPGAFREGRQP